MASNSRGRGYARATTRGGQVDTALKRKAESISGADDMSEALTEAKEARLISKFLRNDTDWSDDFGTPIVTIFLGKDRKKFYAHKGLLASRSPYFERCLDGAWSEGTKHEVVFLEDDPDIFKYILKWMYNPQGWLDLIEGPENESRVYKFYALADRLMITRLQNKILDSYRKTMKISNLLANAACLKGIKSMGLGGSPLMTYMKQCHIWTIMTNADSWTQNAAPDSDARETANITNLQSIFDDRELTNELFVLMVEYTKKPWVDPRGLQGCHFHMHPEGDQKCHVHRKLM